MNSETINQVYLFLIFIINGILIGIIFDIFRILRKSFNTHNIVTYLEDTLFWIISGTLVMYSVFVFNNGAFRAYIFIGILSGVIIYMLFFSKIIVNVSVKIILFIKKIVLFIIKMLLYPLKLLWNCIKVIFIRTDKKIYHKIKRKC